MNNSNLKATWKLIGMLINRKKTEHKLSQKSYTTTSHTQVNKTSVMYLMSTLQMLDLI